LKGRRFAAFSFCAGIFLEIGVGLRGGITRFAWLLGFAFLFDPAVVAHWEGRRALRKRERSLRA